ncbi:15832_t:CDS:2 [Funneliformis caledonium]|uniref:15832_t:CDS:1 n=1 Tax=Funneliformis caledonium TaxID=1117310 RepID=A0A9N9FVS5_9GLOM|nr:15832_t:CDS:2 [Funneliformis caledonium]
MGSIEKFWYILLLLCLTLFIGTFAEFIPGSYLTLPKCIEATETTATYPNDPGWRDAKVGERIRFQRKPLVITYPINTTQVQWLIQCANLFNVKPVPRNGGHSNTGSSSKDNSLVIDLSYMDSVVINAVAQTAVVGGGIRLGPLYIELDKAGFTIISATCPTVGLSGAISSGGFGLQSRKYGVSGDFVLEAEVVTADGSILIANAASYPDLFWALRGGGGGKFGIVTNWKLKLIPVWPKLTVFNIDYSYIGFQEVLTLFWNWAYGSIEDLSVAFVFSNKEIKIHGHFLGGQKDLHNLLDPVGLFKVANAKPKKHDDCTHLGSRAYFLDKDKTCDKSYLLNVGNFPLGPNYGEDPSFKINEISPVTEGVLAGYAPAPKQQREIVKTKSMFFAKVLSVENITTIIERAKAMPDGAYAELTTYGGILETQPTDFTAFPYRNGVAYHILLEVPLTGNDITDEPALNFITSWEETIRPLSNGGSYVGYEDEDLANPESFYFGKNLEKIKIVESKYDPNNVLDAGQRAPPFTNEKCPFVVGGDPPGRRSACVGMNEYLHIYITYLLIITLVLLNIL